MGVSCVVRVRVIDPERERALVRLEKLAALLDSAIEIPGIGVRIGLDAIVGLIPGIGDVLTTLIAIYIVVEGSRMGASKPVVTKMAANVVVDLIVGAVPLVGDLFDVGFKANARNVRLLRRHFEEVG